MALGSSITRKSLKALWDQGIFHPNDRVKAKNLMFWGFFLLYLTSISFRRSSFWLCNYLSWLEYLQPSSCSFWRNAEMWVKKQLRLLFFPSTMSLWKKIEAKTWPTLKKISASSSSILLFSCKATVAATSKPGCISFRWTANSVGVTIPSLRCCRSRGCPMKPQARAVYKHK